MHFLIKAQLASQFNCSIAWLPISFQLTSPLRNNSILPLTAHLVSNPLGAITVPPKTTVRVLEAKGAYSSLATNQICQDVVGYISLIPPVNTIKTFKG